MHTMDQLKKGIEMAQSRGMSGDQITEWMRSKKDHYMYQFSDDDYSYLESLKNPSMIVTKSGKTQLELF